MTPAGIPPFPTGQRETDQHREWMALYRAHARLGAARQPPASHAADDDGTCAVCARLVEPGDAVRYASASLHRPCHAIVSAVEPLGAAGFERLRVLLWPEARRPARKPTRSDR